MQCFAQNFDSTGPARLWAPNGSNPDTSIVIDGKPYSLGSIVKTYTKDSYGCGRNGWSVRAFCLADPDNKLGNEETYRWYGNYFYESAVPAGYCPWKTSVFYASAVYEGDLCPGGGG